jgi:HD-GYP domain-containing protein (c-di-GMP phosphodiesterase class II)
MGAFEIARALGESHRLVQLYPPGHPARDEAIKELVASVWEAVEVRPVALNQRDGRLYEDATLISQSTTGTVELIAAMESHGIEKLTFRTGFRDLDANGISEVLGLRPSPDFDVLRELEARKVRAVLVSEFKDFSLHVMGERQRQRAADRKLYRDCLVALRDLTAALNGAEPVDGSMVQQVLSPLLARMKEDSAALPSLLTLPSHGDALVHHGVDVMLGALIMGHALGLDDRVLLELGRAGLLHDVGFTRAPDEHAEMRHPAAGALMLGALPDEGLTAMLAAYEHHIGADGSGEPNDAPDYRPHAFSRVVRVADRYDELVRPVEGRPMRPDQAVLQLLREAAAGSLDPAVTRLFVQTMGVLPVGSVVRFSDHTVGVVSAPGDCQLQPRVVIVLDTDGLELRPPQECDVGEDERMIVQVLDAAQVDIRPAEYV